MLFFHDYILSKLMYEKVEVTIDFYKIFFYNEKYGENYE